MSNSFPCRQNQLSTRSTVCLWVSIDTSVKINRAEHYYILPYTSKTTKIEENHIR